MEESRVRQEKPPPGDVKIPPTALLLQTGS